MSMHNKNVNTPISKPQTGIDKRNDGGGAPGPKYTIPCPPKPKK